MWHCPHCGAPQAEAARCWVCHRSSTTCSSCRHFRVALSASLGYCALDPRRQALTGLEQRGCWQRRAVADQGPAEPAAVRGRTVTSIRDLRLRAADDEPLPVRGFVPVEDVARPVTPEASGDAGAPPAAAVEVPIVSWETRTSLFGDADR